MGQVVNVTLSNSQFCKNHTEMTCESSRSLQGYHCQVLYITDNACTFPSYCHKLINLFNRSKIIESDMLACLRFPLISLGVNDIHVERVEKAKEF